MNIPSFHDTRYYAAEKVLWTDRIIERMILWAIPPSLTPNHITLFRFIATVPTIMLLANGKYAVGIPVFLVVVLTDALDGALARTRNMITEWGRMFDPLADKLLIIPTLTILIFTNLALGIAVLIIGLEFLIMVAALVWRKRGGTISANGWGKIKMILQVVGIMLLLLSVWLSLPFQMIAALILGTSVFFSIMSTVYHGV